MPRSSVTLVKVFPVASFTAVTVTPGNTAAVASVTVPVRMASCAKAMVGSVNKIPKIRNRLAKFIQILPGGSRWSDDDAIEVGRDSTAATPPRGAGDRGGPG